MVSLNKLPVETGFYLTRLLVKLFYSASVNPVHPDGRTHSSEQPSTEETNNIKGTHTQDL